MEVTDIDTWQIIIDENKSGIFSIDVSIISDPGNGGLTAQTNNQTIDITFTPIPDKPTLSID